MANFPFRLSPSFLKRCRNVTNYTTVTMEGTTFLEIKPAP